MGGKNILPMKALATSLEAAGFECVRTYIQSGNIVLSSSLSDPARVGEGVSKLVLEKNGFEPRTLVLSSYQLRKAINDNPFPFAANATDGKFLHFFFLSSPPTQYPKERLNALARESDRFELVGETFYLYTPEGMADSKVGAQAEKILGTTATARNCLTVQKLAEMLQSE